MAVDIVSTTNLVSPRLNYLLQRARIVKPSVSVEPPLNVSDLVPENESLLGDIEGEKEVRWLAIESAARSVLYSHLGSTKIDDPEFVTVWNVLDILQYCVDQDLCSQQLVLLLIEELLDSQSLADCRTVFGFLESRRESIIAKWSKNKDLVILRLCNELLRRHSRAEDPVFCGRVYVFMFQCFPLGDRSSVNLRGAFHVENVTTFEDYLKDVTANEDLMQVDQDDSISGTAAESVTDVKTQKGSGVPENKDEASSVMDIDTLYPVFWSLQHSFSDPPRLFVDDNFKQFKTSLEASLAKFKEVPKVIQTGSTERSNEQSHGDDSYDSFANAFNPKYLTSRDLFKLELSDLAFQRHILVQALILIDFVLILSEKSKSKPFYQNAQKALQYSFTLGPEDTEWALGIKNAIANYLQEGPEGRHYYRMVDTVLSRDKNWVRWKMESCKPFTRERAAPEDSNQAKTGTQKTVISKKPLKPMGVSKNLDFLYNAEAEKGLSQLRQRQRERIDVPNADSYAEKIRTIESDLEMADAEEEKQKMGENKSSYVWRGLRLASKEQLSDFDKIEHGKGLEALQPATAVIEATGDDNTPADRGFIAQDEHQSVEELRADQSQVTTADTET